MNNAARLLAAQGGYEFNHHGGVYLRGAHYDHRKKVEVAAAYDLEAQESIGGARPNITSVAQECRVSGRVGATHSLGDVPPGNGMALLLLVAVRLLAMQIHGCVVCSGDDLGGLSSFFVVGVGGVQ